MKSLHMVGKVLGLLCVVLCMLLLVIGMYACSKGTLNQKTMSLVARVLKGEDITKERIVPMVPEKEIQEVKREREESRAALKKKEEELDRVQRALDIAWKEVESRGALLDAEQKKVNDLRKKIDEEIALRADEERTKNIAVVVGLFDKMQPKDVTDFLEASSLNDDDIREILKGMKSSKSNKIVTELRKSAKFGKPTVDGGRSRIENILFGAPKPPVVGSKKE